MNPLVLLPLLAAACVAAPAAQFLAAPGLALSPVALQVPVTKTVHYDVKNVVTGYSTNIIKPALAAPAVPAIATVAAAPAVVAAPGQTLVTFQLPGVPEIPGSSGNNTGGQLPGGDQIGQIPGAPGGAPAPQPDLSNPPQIPGQQPPMIPGGPEFPQFPGVSTTAKPDTDSPNDPGNGGDNQNPVQIPGLPALPALPGAPSFFSHNLFNIAAPAPVAVQTPVEAVAPVAEVANDDTDTITVEARSAVDAVPQPAPALTFAAPALTVPAAPARIEAFRPTPPFDQIVTKQAVLAPGRTHTHITPQVTQIQPEITVRRVVQDVAVATPVIAQAPALTFAASPVQVQGFAFAH